MKRLWLFIQRNALAIGIGAIVLLVLAIVTAGIIAFIHVDYFYKLVILSNQPFIIPMGIVYAATFVAMYSVFLRGGFTHMDPTGVKSKQIAIRWDDVVGMEEAKQEAWEVVELIKDRTAITRLGGKAIRGILMIGPPGCGKTYLAKAIATEAKVPFLSLSASQFVEIFVGVGASRMRALFKQARQLAEANGACIVFIDELDAVARRRVFSVFGGTEETNSTQNQLLAEMDGLKAKDANVIVIGATNAQESHLDEALLRPGRFDRKIYVGRPNLQDREKLFQYYLNKIQYDTTVNIGRLARKCVHKTPADIANVVKESILIAARNKKTSIGMKEITEAIERIEMGIKHRLTMTPKEREMTAYHEAGHLITLYILHPTDDVFKASIISRGPALGMVHHTPREEFFTKDKDTLLADIKVSLSGYAAEKIRFGATSNGVQSDFANAMNIAHRMVWKFGMGEREYLGDYTIVPDTQLSETVKEALNQDTQAIFKHCFQDVEKLLRDERVILDRFAKELVDREELDYDEIEAIFAEYGKKRAV